MVIMEAIRACGGMQGRSFAALLGLAVLLVGGGIARAADATAGQRGEDVVAVAADGTKVFGTAYFDRLSADAPLILLFHQARSNGRGEYEPLVGWLNSLGFRVIAWDQRSGGGLYGSENRTVAARGGSTGYCAAYPDLEAALAFAHRHYHPRRLLVWGSSYSGALVFRLALEHADEIDAVIAFSPALGICGTGRIWRKVTRPILAVWPDREASAPALMTTIRDLRAKGAAVLIVPGGKHGSSTLVDARTRHDMSAAREQVAAVLRQLAP